MRLTSINYTCHECRRDAHPAIEFGNEHRQCHLCRGCFDKACAMIERPPPLSVGRTWAVKLYFRAHPKMEPAWLGMVSAGNGQSIAGPVMNRGDATRFSRDMARENCRAQNGRKFRPVVVSLIFRQVKP